MHSAAKKCVVAAIVLAVAGLALALFWQSFLGRGPWGPWVGGGGLGGFAGPDDSLLMTLAWLVPMMNSVERLFFTVAAALIGAAVVIQVLAPRMEAMAEASAEAADESAAEELPAEFPGEFLGPENEPEAPKRTYDPRSYRP